MHKVTVETHFIYSIFEIFAIKNIIYSDNSMYSYNSNMS